MTNLIALCAISDQYARLMCRNFQAVTVFCMAHVADRCTERELGQYNMMDSPRFRTCVSYVISLQEVAKMQSLDLDGQRNKITRFHSREAKSAFQSEQNDIPGGDRIYCGKLRCCLPTYK